MSEKVLRRKYPGIVPGLACGIMIIALLFVGYAGAAYPEGTEMYRGREAAANEVLVKFRGAPPQVVTQAGIGEDVDEGEFVGHARVLRLHSRSRNVDTLIRELSAREDVEYAEPNYIVHALDTSPNDPYFTSGQLYGLSRISAPAAWDISTGSPGIVVGVVDTGIDYTHADLAANSWTAPSAFTVNLNGLSVTCPAGSHGFNAITNSCDPKDDNNHGTHVSGTIGAVGNNNRGVVGVNWDTRVMGLKFLSSSGSGTVANAIKAIEFAIQARQVLGDAANVRVLSNSWGGGGFSQALLDEINRANSAGMLFVAAAGNDAANNDVTTFYPANYNAPNVVSVAATDSADALASFSNYGLTTVDLGAPGVSVISTVRGGSYASYSGTSMATPHVSGAAALLLSKCTLTTAELKDLILKKVDPVSSLAGKTVTGGRLNVNRAIRDCSIPLTPTTTALEAAPASSTYGDDITFTATVLPAAATGTVTFSDGTTTLGSATLSGGTATFTTSALSGGAHSITAAYGGDTLHGRSVSAALQYTVNRAGTTTGLTSSPSSSTFGQQVTFTATVKPSTATGTVTFSDGTTTLGSATLSGGTASLTTSTIPVGDHSITAAYGGDGNYEASTSAAVSLKVTQAASSTSLVSSLNPSGVGQTVTFTATVTPPAATGSVTFKDDGLDLGMANLAGGKASLATSSLPAGTHQITATYSGDANVAGSTSSPLTQTVNTAPAGDFSLSASPSTRSIYRGSSTTYTVTVTRTSGFTGPVSMTVSGLPTGATGTFSPNPATGTSSTLTVRTTTGTPTGTYTLTIKGTSGSLVHTTAVSLQVRRWFFG